MNVMLVRPITSSVPTLTAAMNVSVRTALALSMMFALMLTSASKKISMSVVSMLGVTTLLARMSVSAKMATKEMDLNVLVSIKLQLVKVEVTQMPFHHSKPFCVVCIS